MLAPVFTDKFKCQLMRFWSQVRFKKLNGIDITLYPGDVLYIPPYWFPLCLLLWRQTLSVNVWSQSEAFNTMETIYSLPLPFEESWAQELLLKNCWTISGSILQVNYLKIRMKL